MLGGTPYYAIGEKLSPVKSCLATSPFGDKHRDGYEDKYGDGDRYGDGYGDGE